MRISDWSSDVCSSDLMKTLPLFIAHESELPAPGDFITRELLGMPLITARHSDGSVQTYLKMCRHRGGRVEQDARGNKPVVMCRDHGWSYEPTGGGSPHGPSEAAFQPNAPPPPSKRP